MSFGVGDTIYVLDTMENGWWMGKCRDDVGWFPGSYVEVTCISTITDLLGIDPTINDFIK